MEINHDAMIQLLEQLRAPLPKGALHTHRNNPDKKFVPVEWYEYMLETLVGPDYCSEVRETEINVSQGYVKVVSRIYVGPKFHDGIGCHLIDNGNIQNAVDRANAESFRNAVDKYLMGWHEIGVYRENNIPVPGQLPAGGTSLQDEEDPDALTEHTCLKCRKALTKREINVLKTEYPWMNMIYHPPACLPKHLAVPPGTYKK